MLCNRSTRWTYADSRQGLNSTNSCLACCVCPAWAADIVWAASTAVTKSIDDV